MFKDDQLIHLKTAFRQKEDKVFLDILNELRLGKLSRNSISILQEKCNEYSVKMIEEKKSIIPTKIFSRNVDVNAMNTRKLRELNVESSKTYKRIESGNEYYLKSLRTHGPPEELELRIGAQVMLTRNLNVQIGLANGTKGIVCGYDENDLPQVEFAATVGGMVTKMTEIVEMATWNTVVQQTEVASVSQIPLVLGWCTTIHKAQGMTIPQLDVSFAGMFADGQAYTALSRCSSLDGLYLSCFDVTRISANEEVISFYEKFSNSSESSERNDLIEVNLLSLTYTPSMPPEINDSGWISTKIKATGEEDDPIWL